MSIVWAVPDNIYAPVVYLFKNDACFLFSDLSFLDVKKKKKNVIWHFVTQSKFRILKQLAQ